MCDKTVDVAYPQSNRRDYKSQAPQGEEPSLNVTEAPSLLDKNREQRTLNVTRNFGLFFPLCVVNIS